MLREMICASRAGAVHLAQLFKGNRFELGNQMMARKRWKVSASAREADQSKPFGYRRSNGTINLHVFKAEYLSKTEECASVMAELDELRVGFDANIREMRAIARDTGVFAKPEMYHATLHLCHLAKNARNNVQDRRGQLRRQFNSAKARADLAHKEHRFIEAAKRVLTKEQYLSIWEQVKEDYPIHKPASASHSETMQRTRDRDDRES